MGVFDFLKRQKKPTWIDLQTGENLQDRGPTVGEALSEVSESVGQGVSSVVESTVKGAEVAGEFIREAPGKIAGATRTGAAGYKSWKEGEEAKAQYREVRETEKASVEKIKAEAQAAKSKAKAERFKSQSQVVQGVTGGIHKMMMPADSKAGQAAYVPRMKTGMYYNPESLRQLSTAGQETQETLKGANVIRLGGLKQASTPPSRQSTRNLDLSHLRISLGQTNPNMSLLRGVSIPRGTSRLEQIVRGSGQGSSRIGQAARGVSQGLSKEEQIVLNEIKISDGDLRKVFSNLEAQDVPKRQAQQIVATLGQKGIIQQTEKGEVVLSERK